MAIMWVNTAAGLLWPISNPKIKKFLSVELDKHQLAITKSLINNSFY